MPWLSLGEITLTQDWQISTPVEGEIFRIRHLSLDNPKKEYLKAVISPAFVDDGLNILSPKRLTYREEREIFLFYFPSGVASQQLAFKRLDVTDIQWTVSAEVFIAESTESDFSNYIVARFAELMPLFSNAKIEVNFKELIPAVNTVNVSTTATKIVNAEPQRRSLSICHKSGDSVQIAAVMTTVNNIPTLQGILATLDPGCVYELPMASDSFYTGAIHAKCVKSNGTAQLDIVEFVPSV
ncbi:MAG: hypothetical protein C6Y22_17530 [Hapalosiphonaceae cyanobacterium JJU2]|nr:MAG: hypothetical protein C6Y22_17530 [Hapalosiphonaceae cyanobacterium JJU2]